MSSARSRPSRIGAPLRRLGWAGHLHGRSVHRPALLTALAAALSLNAAPQAEPPAASIGSNGRLVYAPDARGNRIPDFSHCGYAGGDGPIPDAPVRVVVAPTAGDSTERIQKALDYVSALPLDSDGLRGAVLLLKGRHEVFGGLRIESSGVVIRGQGMGEDGSLLVAAGKDRRTLIRVVGRSDRVNPKGLTWQIDDPYVPVGAKSFHLKAAGQLTPGDRVNIIRPSTAAWIERLGMTEFGGGHGDWRLTWKPGSRDLIWDRVVVSNNDGMVTVDAPITTAIEAALGGGRVEAYKWPGRISNVGVENLRCESAFDAANPKDENHSWFVITMENAEDAWVRQVTAKHFSGSLAAVYESCKHVTVQDCASLEPVSEEGGYRRHTFFTMGQMTLFLNCYAEHGRHDFSAGHCAAGPNAFVQCAATLPLRDSGPIESWASGVLYDCVTIDGNGLGLANRGANPHGAGWAAANSVLWQCSASIIRCANPPGAQNWAFGCWGEFEGDGIWRSSNESVRPYSLYVAQLSDRIGAEAARRVRLLPAPGDASSNPSMEKAAELTAAASRPGPQLAEFIATASARCPIPSDPGQAKAVEAIQDESSARGTGTNSRSSGIGSGNLSVSSNGWLCCGDRIATGRSTGVPWWRGNIRPAEAASSGVDVTRYVPGRVGPGYTDDLAEVADSLIASGAVALDHNYGLWHERRRDDHERVRRASGDVWPPFYELPFARSGRGLAWDGLSLYDLSRYNPWYWNRLEEFAAICDRRGLVLFHQNYFQHNILEAGAHWADFPWRTANNINNTGFPEPPPYAGDKRIFMAEQFYDVSHPVRRQLHRAYIRKCLELSAGHSNVIQFTSAEYTGPRHFVEFWLDTIAEWEQETGKRALVALSCTKDVQDTILADSRRSAVVDVVDFRYWWQTSKGLYAPPGGKNLAPRQFERQWKGGRPTDLDLAQMVAEYRRKYPGKAVICDFDAGGWAYLCAGGSLPRLPGTVDSRLLAAIPRLRPWPEASGSGRWVLRGPGEYLVYLGRDAEATLDLVHEGGTFVARRIGLAAGEVTAAEKVAGGRNARLPKSSTGAEVLWLTKE